MPQQTNAPKKGNAMVYVLVAIIIILAIALAVALTGTKSLGNIFGQLGQAGHQVPPKQMLLNDYKAYNNVHNLQVDYALSLPFLGSELSDYLGPNGTINVSLSILDNRTSKLLMNLGSIGGVTAIYSINGTSVTCTESTGSLYASSSLLCELGASEDLPVGNITSTGAEFNYSSVSYQGTKNIAGDQCNQYLITITPENFTSAINSSYTQRENNYLSYMSDYLGGNTTTYLSDCVSTAHGIPDRISVYTSSYSKLLAKNTTTYLLNFTASSISTASINPESLQVPVNASVGYTDCSTTALSLENLTTFVSSSNRTLLVKNITILSGSYGQNSTISLKEQLPHAPKFGSSYPFNITLPSGEQMPEYFEEHPQICTTGYCTSTYCYVYQPYNYSEYTTSIPYYNYNTTTIPATESEAAVTTPNANPTMAGNIIYPSNVVYYGTTSSFGYNYMTDANQTFIPDGKSGTLTLWRNSSLDSSESAFLDWNFNKTANGTLYVKWGATITPCSNYSGYTKALVSLQTGCNAGDNCDTTGEWLNASAVLNNSVRSVGPFTAVIHGSADSLGLDADTWQDELACPLNVSIDGVWAVT